MCYVCLVLHKFHYGASQYHISPHKFFRLLTYTASYF